MSDESATACHCSRYEGAALCSGHLNYLSTIREDKAADLKLLSLFVIPKNSEDLRQALSAMVDLKKLI